MDEIKYRILQHVLAKVGPELVAEIAGASGYERLKGNEAFVQQIVAAFAEGIAEEGVALSASERRDLMEEVMVEVLAGHQPRPASLATTRNLNLTPTAERLIRWGTWNQALVDYLRACMAAGRSVLVSGSEGAGKTSMLGVLATFVPEERIVSVERELQLQIDHQHVVRLQGDDGEILERALMLAPERLILVEIKAQSALNALQTMAAVPTLAAIEGTSAEAVTSGLIEMAGNAAPGMSETVARRLVANNVDVVLNMAHLLDGSRRVTEVVEVLPEPQSETGMRLATILRLDESGQLAATGTESTFVTSTFLQTLPSLEVPLGAEAFAPAPVSASVSEATIVEVEILPIPEPETAVVEVEPPAPKEKPEKRRGLFGRRKPAPQVSGLGSSRASSKGAPTLDKAKSAAARGAAIAAMTEQTDYESLGQGKPLVQVMTTYLTGDDLFEESYSVEEGIEFLGEMGVSIAHTIGDERPKQVAGFEVWIFDKETLKTLSAFVFSEGAFADEELRATHQERGEVLAAVPGESAILETGALRLEVRVKGAEFSANGQSFERGTIELAVWRGASVGAEVPATLPALDESLPAMEAMPPLIHDDPLPELETMPPLTMEPEAAIVEVEPSTPEEKPKKRRGLFGRRKPAPQVSGLGSSRASSKGAPTLEKAKSAAARGAAIAAMTEQTDYESLGQGKPLVQVMTTYLIGDDLFEESYSIEEGIEFLGEMGVSIAHTIGDERPKQVAGFEVWIFDKETLKTLSAFVFSEGAFADEEFRVSHQERGEVLAAIPGQSAALDTGALQLLLQVKGAEFSADGQSFERGTIELAVWRTGGAE